MEESEIRIETYKLGCGDQELFNCHIGAIYQWDTQHQS